MSLQMYHELKDMLARELEEIVQKGELSPGMLETVDKLTHSIKSVETIIAMHGAYSGRRYSRNDAREEMVNDLRGIMESTRDDRMRRKLHSFISEIENA